MVEIIFAEQLAIIIALTIVVCTDIFINPIFVATMPTHKAYTEHNNNSPHILMIFPKEKASGTRGNICSLIKKIKKIKALPRSIPPIPIIDTNNTFAFKRVDLSTE